MINSFKYFFSTFHALYLFAVLCVFALAKYSLIPSYLYYFVWQTTFVVLVFSIILSAYFNKSKLFVLMLFPLFFNLALAFPTTLFNKLSITAFWNIVPLVTALSYLMLYTLQERGLMSTFGFIRIGLAIAMLIFGFCALKYFSPSLQLALETPLLHVKIKSLIQGNDLAFIIASIALSFILLISLLFKTQSQKAPFWILLAQMIPCLLMQESNSYILFSLLSALIATTALIHDAYRMAYVDTLTGVPSRRALEEHFLRLGSHYLIAMVDIDFFKKFNDTFGHDVGDDVLRLIATELTHIKHGGKVYRYGGEEFTIVFNGKKKELCIEALEEVRERIFHRGFIIRDKENRPKKAPKNLQKSSHSKKERLSVSIGVALSQKNKTPQEIIKIADSALYKAKESGRNCLISQ